MSEPNEDLNFEGKLQSINPKRLINIEKNDDVSNFFLVLATFYNELKNLTFYLVSTKKIFKDVNQNKVSVELGELGGLVNHLERMTAATIHEFFEFLKSSEEEIKTTEFNLIYDRLNKDLKNRWDLLIKISKGKNVDETAPFAKVLELIRNNIAFHISGKEMRKGFIEVFYKDKKYFGNDTAYYSIGEGNIMKDTRFFYCDAAIQRMIRGEVERAGKIKYEEYVKGLKEVVEHINFTLAELLKIYLPQLPH